MVGMACRFPDARNTDQFWENLCRGRESITFFAPEQLDPHIPEELKSDPDYVRARGVLQDVDKFDAGFFKVTPREAELMDPQQRVMLELAWAALENAGCDPAAFPGLIGVFAGVGNNTYYVNNVLSRPDLVATTGPFTAMVSNEKDYVAPRISHKLNLKGPQPVHPHGLLHLPGLGLPGLPGPERLPVRPGPGRRGSPSTPPRRAAIWPRKGPCWPVTGIAVPLTPGPRAPCSTTGPGWLSSSGYPRPGRTETASTP